MIGTVMVVRRGDDPRPLPSETSLRVIMRGLREIMAEGGEGQEKLDRIVRQIAGVMVAEVCSIYLNVRMARWSFSRPKASIRPPSIRRG